MFSCPCLPCLGNCINRGCSHDRNAATYALVAIPVLFTFWILAGFSKDKALDVYQQKKYTRYFICPYQAYKVGSCSETFRQGGIRALARKCKATSMGGNGVESVHTSLRG